MDPQRLIEFFENGIPFNAHVGMRVEALQTGRCTLRLPFRPEWVGDPFRPALHGGLMSTLADAAGGLAVFSTVDQLGRVSTVDMRIDFLRPGLLEDLWCEAWVVRAGNRVAVTTMRVFQKDGAHVPVEGRGVYNVIRAEGAADG